MTRLRPEGEAIETWGTQTAPDGFVWQGASHHILEIGNRWQVHTRWWEPDQALWREYLKATTNTGFLCLLYRNLPDGGWFLARLYD